MSATTTQLADVIIPDVWSPYVIERSPELTAFWESGVISRDPEFDAKASGEGNTVNMPFWKDLTGADEVLEDDSSLTPSRIETGQDVAVLMNRGKAWRHNDLVSLLSGADPAAAVGELVADYWARRHEEHIFSVLTGIFTTALTADLTLDLFVPDGSAGTIDLDNVLDGASFIDACQLMGDNKKKLSAVGMHSLVESHLLKLNLIEFRPDSEGQASLPFFQGKRVIIDDSFPIETIDGKLVFSTFLFGAGALALGMSGTDKPAEGGVGTWAVEFFREALAGNSGLINRRRFLIHPRGVKWTGNSVAGSSPSNAELATGSNWTKVWDKKNIRIVRVRHNILPS